MAGRLTARAVAHRILCRVEGGARLDASIDADPDFRNLARRDRSLVNEILYGTLRQRSFLDEAISRHLKRRRKLDPAILSLLRIGAYQIIFLSRIPHSAAVNEAVEQAKALGGDPVAGFVNGLLRALARDPIVEWPHASTHSVDYLSARYSHPAWLVRRWLFRVGVDRLERILAENNQAAPVVLRLNRIKTTVDRYRERLERAGVAAAPGRISPTALRLSTGAEVSGLPGYAEGEFYVQDEAAQLIAPLLHPTPGQRILDACAAPGGKTTHLAELMEDEGEILALDSEPSRLGRLRENVERLGLRCVFPVLGDAGGSLSVLGNKLLDGILLDVPCSGLGLLRRNPEGRWQKTESLISSCAVAQLKILDSVAPLLKAGGCLVYSTCTTEPEENAEIIGRFLARHPDYSNAGVKTSLPAAARRYCDPDGFLDTFGNDDGMDGFFAARLLKRTN